MMFWFGLMLGMSAGIILMAIVTAIGFYEAMSLKGERNGKNKV